MARSTAGHRAGTRKGAGNLNAVQAQLARYLPATLRVAPCERDGVGGGARQF
ncbi:hypothetical protein [Cupriavidus necator]|uniref:hypothetical protein n=1 Tax=Cupriavidus necator TaxID=106590 RepID=UPI0013DECB6D|nr:hypothetical protein [Cupriavidus necator]